MDMGYWNVRPVSPTPSSQNANSNEPNKLLKMFIDIQSCVTLRKLFGRTAT